MPSRRLLAIVLLISACKKDLQSDKIAAGTVSDLSTDGTLSVQVSIAPPVTPAGFLPNSSGGSASLASYDLVAGPKKVYIDYFHMTASYPTVLEWVVFPTGMA